MNDVILESTLTCPSCGHAKTETMPTDACQWFYECEQCHTVLKPKAGDCCVYCLRCPSNFVFQRAALMPPWIADCHAR
jgi:hypothetical protein